MITMINYKTYEKVKIKGEDFKVNYYVNDI